MTKLLYDLEDQKGKLLKLKYEVQEIERFRKIMLAKSFCELLDKNDIGYEWCIKHNEVLGCSMSREYYQKYEHCIGQNYSICKNILVQERNGERRIFLIIVDDTKKVDLAKFKEIYNTKKLEFVSEETMKSLINTTPGNVSIYNTIYDTNNKINLFIDKDLLEYNLLAFHPLYNGMSLFSKPIDVIKFLSLINHSYTISKIPEKEQIKTLKLI